MKTQKNYSSEVYPDLRHLYRASVEQYRDRILFRQKGDGEYRDVTYRKFGEDVDALGTELCARGLMGAHVMLVGENCYAWVTSYLCVACGVGVIVPADKDASPEQLARIAEQADVTAVICSSACLEKLSLLPAGIGRILFDELPTLIELGNDRILTGDRTYLDAEIDEDELRVLIFTSGITGDPKGVMLSHKNICFGLAEICKMIKITGNDRFLSVLPLHHTYECTFGFLCPMYRGATVIFAEGVRHIAQSMRETQPTVFLSVPLLVETLYEKLWEAFEKRGEAKKVRRLIALSNIPQDDASRTALKRRMLSKVLRIFGGNLRMIITAGYAADPEVLKGYRDLGIHVLHGYALTECTPLAALNRDNAFRDASAGLSLPNTLLDIYDVQPDGTGEIRFKGKNLMLGYYKEEALTEKVIRGGWFYTGDLGYIDKNGFLYITGRKKNVIVGAGGRNVYPEELEGLLVRAPFVDEALVVGYPNEETHSYDVVAVIYPSLHEMEETYGKNFAKSQLDFEMKRSIADLNSRLEPHKRITGYVLRREPFAKNSSRKIIRAGVAEAAYDDYLATKKKQKK